MPPFIQSINFVGGFDFLTNAGKPPTQIQLNIPAEVTTYFNSRNSNEQTFILGLVGQAITQGQAQVDNLLTGLKALAAQQGGQATAAAPAAPVPAAPAPAAPAPAPAAPAAKSDAELLVEADQLCTRLGYTGEQRNQVAVFFSQGAYNATETLRKIAEAQGV